MIAALALALLGLAALADGPARAPVPTRPPPLGDAFDAPGAPVAVSVARTVAGPVSGARALGAVAVEAADASWGGLSGLALAPDGERFIVVSDRGMLFRGRLRRVDGALAGIAGLRASPLADESGRPIAAGSKDAEALAIDPEGALLVAFEKLPARIWRYARPTGAARRVGWSDAFHDLDKNGGFEALAVRPDGVVFAIAERALDDPDHAPVFRRSDHPILMERGRYPLSDGFAPTGADIGPDGRLYVLERRFRPFGGFAARLRRADPADWPDLAPEPVAVLTPFGVDNLEGVALWRDGEGRLRALFVADDNFLSLQRTIFLEVALPEGPLRASSPR